MRSRSSRWKGPASCRTSGGPVERHLHYGRRMMRIRPALFLPLLWLPLTTACSKPEVSDQPETSAEQKADKAAAVLPAPSQTPEGKRTLSQRLRGESEVRPTGTPRAEDVLAALATAGIQVKGVKQYLGSTVQASFCMGGQTTSRLAIAVCEYSDEQAAMRGRTYSLEKFRGIAPSRAILVNRKTTLTLSGSSSSAADGAEAKSVQAVFVAQ